MRSKKCLSGLLLIVTLINLSGCATIVSKSKYPVAFGSSPSGSTITITDTNGNKIHKGKTPTTVTLKSSAGFFERATYNIKFEKEGYEPRVMVLEATLDGWYLGNLLFAYGVVIGLVVDPLTGAMWKLPQNINVELEGKSAALAVEKDSIKIATIDDIPQNLRSKLIRIN